MVSGGDTGPVLSEIGIHLSADFDAAHFGASPPSIHRFGLQIARLRVSKIGRQVGIEGGLIAFGG